MNSLKNVLAKGTIIILIIIYVIILLSGCVGVKQEQTYTHIAPYNNTEYLTLYPDGTFIGVFYEDRYFPHIELSGVYRITEKEVILTTPTGNTIILTKADNGLLFEGDLWA